MTAAGGASDAQLVERVLAGDREAFGEVYERYSDRLFDFAVGMLRNREDAADAVADSFVTMAERLTQLRDPSRLRPWLYAVVRRECLRRLKARTKVAYGDDDQLAALPDDGALPEEQAEAAAMRELVWAAAEGLNERDQALLDLHLRHGLEGQELADAMGISAGNAYTSLNRLKTQLERALGALLVARQGSADCAALGVVLDGWDGTFSVLMRKRVARHVDQCVVCDQRRAALAPLSLVAGVPLLLAPSSLRDRVLGDVRLVSHFSDGGSGGGSGGAAGSAGGPTGTAGGFTGGATAAGSAGTVAAVRRRRFVQLLPVVAAMLVIGLIVAVGVLNRDGTVLAESETGAEGDEMTAAEALAAGEVVTVLPSPDPLSPVPTTADPTVAPPRTAPPTTAPPTTAPPTTAPPAPGIVVLVRPSLLDLGEQLRVGDVTLSNTGDQAVDYAFTPGAAWVLQPAAGTLPAGQSVVVPVAIDRQALPVGTSDAPVTVTWASGAASFTVRATVLPPPGRTPSLQAP